MKSEKLKFDPAEARSHDARPLPRQRGLSYMTNTWGMVNRHGGNVVNTIRPERPEVKTRFVGFRLVSDLNITNDNLKETT